MGAVTPTILSEGQPMDPGYEVLSIDIRREVNRIPQAEIRVIDGDAAKRAFTVSDATFFEPGAAIEIKLRYEGGEDTTVFKGVVVRHGIEASHEGSVLVVGVKDAAVKLTGARRSAVYSKMTDDAIIQKLITDAGLTAGTVEATQPEHAEMVQYNATAWDFIVSRADAQGLLVAVEDGTISLLKMALADSAAHRFEYGISEILNVEIEADAGHQFEGVESVAWSLKEQKLTDAAKAASAPVSPGNLDGEKLGKALGNGTFRLSHPVPVAPEELKAWADARMARSRMALCRGRIGVPGFAGLKLLDGMEIAGIGARFNGATVVTGFRHRVDASGWRTDVQFGLPPEGFSRSDHIADAPAAGLLPAVSGLQMGVVADFASDDEEELRVKVRLPGIDEDKKGIVWARLASPEAGKGRGSFFRPEPGDEVVVGFLNDDPRHPVILGSLFGSKNAPPEAMGTPSDKNEQKGIVTKKGTTIGFVDADKASVFIETASKNKLLLDDDAESISLTDQHGSSITLSKDGIVLKSAKDLVIDAGGDVEIKAGKSALVLKSAKDLTIDASGNVEIKGSKVDVK
ncbi:MAG: type VI secretion system tip protein VgrG [Polyangiaceae bacterium]|nr:type VI secretion system tip protein VgrG [Polyangiaceae bacterium]